MPSTPTEPDEYLVGNAGKHQRVSDAHGTPCGKTSRAASGYRRTDHHAGNHRDEQPGEAVGRYAEAIDEESRRARDVDEEGGEVERRNRRQQQEIGMAHDRCVAVKEFVWGERLPAVSWQGLGQLALRP